MKVKTKRNKWIMGAAEGLLLLSLLMASPSAVAQPTTGTTPQKEVATASADSSDVLAADSLSADSTLTQEIDSVSMAAELEAGEQTGGLRQVLKKKFLEGNAGFMSLVALALVLGLAFSIERIIYLTLSEIKAYKLMEDIEGYLKNLLMILWISILMKKTKNN